MASDGNQALADHEDRKAIVSRYKQGREKVRIFQFLLQTNS